MQGRDNRSPHLILSMVRNLPIESLLSATLSAQHEVALRELKSKMTEQEYEELVSEVEAEDELSKLIHEKQAWTLPNILLAMQVNQQAPGDEAIVGPSVWTEEEKVDEQDDMKAKVASFFKQMGGIDSGS